MTPDDESFIAFVIAARKCMSMPEYPQYVRDLVKEWAAGDEHAGHVIRYLSSTPEERLAMLALLRDAQALAADERPAP